MSGRPKPLRMRCHRLVGAVVRSISVGTWGRSAAAGICALGISAVFASELSGTAGGGADSDPATGVASVDSSSAMAGNDTQVTAAAISRTLREGRISSLAQGLLLLIRAHGN